jgi:hypothetical protein
MSAPVSYLSWVNRHIGFNPRAQANSDALSDMVAGDLRKVCPQLDAVMRAAEVEAKKNANVPTKVAERNVDLVFLDSLGAVRASVENKTIMTAHGKARKNRYGNVIAYANHMHNHSRECVAGAVIIVNQSGEYENPNGFAKGLKRPKFNMPKIVADTIGIFEKIPLRETPADPYDQPEAIAVILVDYDGRRPARLVTGGLAPGDESPVNYGNFLERMAGIYCKRF